ncbi:MAG: hypothetical protein GKR93_16250 [Gammaproteobacteria bacterium]|nr:hypothetical protein [Gammaproteobacteria bacterium]
MEIESITTALRPRNNWETIDLGFNMAQQWFLPLILLWLAAALPAFLFLYLAPFIDVIWMGIIIWWLKPLFEQVQLYYVSRALFGEFPSLRQVLKQYWSISKTQIIPLLTWRRLSFSRNFNNPVAMLEGLSGKERIKRLNLLHLTQRNASQWLHIFCYTFETTLWFGFCVLLLSLIPENSNWLDFDSLTSYQDSYAGVIGCLLYLIAMAIMAPFYICAGFALYLTRRTELEGWDIELNFRRIAGRLRKLRAPLIICLSWIGLTLSTVLTPVPAYALGQVESKEMIAEVLSQEQFGKVETVKRWVLVDDKTENKNLDFDLSWLISALKGLVKWFGETLPEIAGLFKFLLWTIAIILILYLVSRFTSWLDWLGLPQIKSGKKYVPPSRLFGMEINSESLPEDIVGSVRNLILTNQFREALSLLYRASLIQLIYLHQLEITESTTESECKRMVSLLRPEDEAKYFSSLTQTWLFLAYAHESPQKSHLILLCDTWPQYYGKEHGTK